MKEKKKRKRLKRILPFICATLLLLGSSVTVFATSKTNIPYSNYSMSMLKQIAIDSGLVDDMSDYDYMTVTYKGVDDVYIYTTKEPLYVSEQSNSNWLLGNGDCMVYQISTNLDRDYSELYTKEYIDENGYSFLISYSKVSTSYLIFNTSDELDNYLLATNYDICASDGSLFFQQPLPVVPKAIQTAQLPEVIQKQITIILPIAVGCLALVIGSIVLLPRLKNFLAG